jgi:hypothetical protein
MGNRAGLTGSGTGIVPPFAITRRLEIAYEVGMLKPTDTSFNPESVTAQVSGYYKDACTAVANLVTGRFPDYSEVPEEPSLFE